jgi:hypothetical protein
MHSSLHDAEIFLSRNFESLCNSVIPLWHPLGFVSAVIFETEKATARVHYWPPHLRRVKNPDWPIHTHSYDLDSKVLLGGVCDQQYEPETGVDWVVFEVAYFEGGSKIIETNERTSLTTLVNDVRVAPDSYSVPRGRYHQTTVPEEAAAVTLCVQSNQTPLAPRVLGSSGTMRTYPYDRIPFDEVEFWGVVRGALGKIS